MEPPKLYLILFYLLRTQKHLVIFFNIRYFLRCPLHSLQNDPIQLRKLLLCLCLNCQGSALLRKGALNLGIGIFLTQMNIFADIPLALPADTPSPGLKVFQTHIHTRVALVAPQNNRKQHTIPYHYILHPHVRYTDSLLRLTSPFGVERIQHAPRPHMVGLLLLLGSQVNCPPNRLEHSYVLVDYLVNYPTSTITWISLDVDSLQRFLHNYIPESDISHTIALLTRRYTPHRQPHSQPDSNILDQ